jgi:hypothetical protein
MTLRSSVSFKKDTTSKNSMDVYNLTQNQQELNSYLALVKTLICVLSEYAELASNLKTLMK